MHAPISTCNWASSPTTNNLTKTHLKSRKMPETSHSKKNRQGGTTLPELSPETTFSLIVETTNRFSSTGRPPCSSTTFLWFEMTGVVQDFRWRPYSHLLWRWTTNLRLECFTSCSFVIYYIYNKRMRKQRKSRG